MANDDAASLPRVERLKPAVRKSRSAFEGWGVTRPRATELATLPLDGTARLPVRYATACSALAECAALDECQAWADKAEAMASYARQARDDTLRKMADRIQARAIRRCGELLKQVPASAGGRPSETREGTL